MSEATIILSASLTTQDLKLVLEYFNNPSDLTPQMWKILLKAFDLLASSTIKIAQTRFSFKQYYGRFIDQRFADDFIAQLIDLNDLSQSGETLQKRFAANILKMLENDGIYDEQVIDSEYLAAYCLYWWTSFARGYRFEVQVFRELKAEKIVFMAHDLRKRTERYSPYDIVVLRQVGDIKNSTYFLYNARSLPLRHDFYITQLYVRRQRQYWRVVIMREAAWHKIDGDVAVGSLETATRFFPKPVLVSIENNPYVIVSFELWKAKVKHRQQQEHD